MCFNFHFLGTNGFHSNETSRTACYMIPELGILFDAGSGFFRVKELIQTPYLEVFISHGHMDHVAGINCLIELLNRPDFKQIRIHAEQKVLDEIDTLFHDPFFPEAIPYELVPLNMNDNEEDNVIECIHEGVKVNYFQLNHTTTCFGYRLSYEGKSIAYVTDTTSYTTSTYLKHLNNLDVLFHEVNSVHECDSAKFGHTDAENLAVIANVVKPKLLCLIHFNPNRDRYEMMECVKKEYPNVMVAVDKEFVTV